MFETYCKRYNVEIVEGETAEKWKDFLDEYDDAWDYFMHLVEEKKIKKIGVSSVSSSACFCPLCAVNNIEMASQKGIVVRTLDTLMLYLYK